MPRPRVRRRTGPARLRRCTAPHDADAGSSLSPGAGDPVQVSLRALGAGSILLPLALASLACAPVGPRASAREAWQPERPTFVVFSRRQRNDANHDIWIAAADGRGQRRLTRSAGDEQTPRFSPDGQTIVFRAAADPGAAPDIWTMRRDGTGKRNLTRTPRETEWSPAFTPDGRRIVYSCGSASAGTGNDLCMMNGDGSDRHFLLRDPNGSEEYPSFAPGGTRFAYIHYDSGGVFQVWTARTDGRGRHNLTGPTETSTWPAWSRDGRIIAFKRPSSLGDVWVMRPDGSGKRNLTHTPMLDEQFPAWLPDGRLAFTRGDGHDERSYGIWVMHGDGSHQTELIQDAAGWSDWTAR